MQIRQSNVNTITGTSGSGKSYLSKELAKKIAKITGGKTLVITYSGIHKTWADVPKLEATPEAIRKFNKSTKAKIRQIVYSDKEDETLGAIYKNFTNGTLILDDLQAYISSNWSNTPGLKPLIIDHRPLNLDIFLVAHEPVQIPPKLWTFVKYAFIMKSTVPTKSELGKLSQFKKLVEYQNQVNAEYSRIKRTGTKPLGIKKVLQM